ncbi:MAG: PaaI family thioesterase, partial [Acidimicrobiia bacterium]
MRTHEWSEPVELAESARPLSGQEFFVAWSEGEITPPMAATLGFGLEDFGDGHVEISCTPDEFHYNPYGTVHGGLAATLLDAATGCVIQTRLPAGAGYATLDLSVNYLRPITTETGTVSCVGKVLSMGRTVAVSEAEVQDQSGRVLARATATCLLITPDP